MYEQYKKYVSSRGFSGVFEFVDGPADHIAEGDDPDAVAIGVDDGQARNSVVEHDPGGGSQGGVWTDRDKLASHDLVGPAIKQ